MVAGIQGLDTSTESCRPIGGGVAGSASRRRTLVGELAGEGDVKGSPATISAAGERGWWESKFNFLIQPPSKPPLPFLLATNMITWRLPRSCRSSSRNVIVDKERERVLIK
ncbi:hypothetical protein J6590_052498 [Homalodisca vitripennis]|nr:hypothetical protein J6590_052498 [Homalodisca vitripennis]